MESSDALKKRIAMLMLAVFSAFTLLTLRLGWLQLARGRELAALAAKYHSRTVFYRWGHGSEGRGSILDRNLRPLTEAKLKQGLAVFTVVGCREEDYDTWLHWLEYYTGLGREEIVDRSSLRRPLPLVRPLPQDLALPHWIMPVAGEWDEHGNFRRYSYDKLACHVLGFITGAYKGERAPGLLVGRLGIEKSFDDLLRCQRPGVSAMVDANNQLISGLGYRSTIDPMDQPNVVLSLDLEVQRIVERVFDNYIDRGLVPTQGAIVVMDPHNGDVLAMVSRPAIAGASYQHNRATRKSNNVTMLPLASVVKVITAAAALEKNPDLLHARYSCSGSLNLHGNSFHCLSSHGEQDMAEALSNSCNLYFAQLAMEVGGRDLLSMVAAMGLGTKPDLGLPGSEVDSGSLPGPEDLASPAGLTNHFAMGGNKLEVTPVQVAAMLSSIANGGYYVEPRLVLAINHDPSARLKAPAVKKEKIMRITTAQMVARMMHGAVADSSSYRAFPLAAEVLAAKTGTSDAVPPMGYHIRWNAGFFPWRNPKYVVVYMAEVPPAGGTVQRSQIVAEIVEGLSGLD